MTTARDLDFAPLTRSTGTRSRLRAAGRDNLMVMGATLGVLLLLVPAAVFVGLVVSGNATDVGGLVVLAMLFGAGGYLLFGILRESGGGGALDGFARVNDLDLVQATLVPDYAGSFFADETCSVRQSVRTKDRFFREVGERFPVTATAGAGGTERPQLFLRARLTGRVSGVDRHDLVTPALDEALTRFTGGYLLEVSGDELTVFGRDRLGIQEPGRVQQAFALLDALAARADDSLPDGPTTTSAGTTIPVPPRPGPRHARLRRPVTIVAWTLALLVVMPILFAVVMSVLDDHLRDVTSARLVVSLLVLVALAVTARLARAALTARPTDGDEPVDVRDR